MREKLVELLITADDYEERVCKSYSCKTCPYNGTDCTYKSKADHLIANGVTFAEDNNAPSKWISVKDRLPEEEEKVLIYTKTGIANYGTYTKRYGFACNEGFICGDGFMWLNTASHWQPMPQPPKGE